MKIFNDKKGMTWQQIVLAIIALVVVTLIIIWFSGAGKKGYGSIGDKIDQTGDCDKDNSANLFDKCPCDPNITDELKSGEKCGSSSSEAIKNCPNDCK